MNFKEELIKTFKNYNIEVNNNQAELFETFYNLIIEYNKNVNLTAIVEQSEVILKHFLDSVLCIDNFNQNTKLIDIGSGAGFPAIPIKIMRPDIEIIMIDGLNKRVNFLNEVIKELKLSNIKAMHCRCEDLAHNIEYREMFDYCVARAVAGLNTLAEYCLPFVKVYGFFVAYKSKNINVEIGESKKALDVLGGSLTDIKIYNIEEINAERDFVFIKKKFKTPSAYPRAQNKPKTTPIV